ncbi:transcriptional regulator (plasmid) [Rhizobium ruizarguesonis]|jgi:hypothetical protein|uniref:transcriptional regulator n=1 Tax=Rhizobium ruizarguesonis TaxID=2081791 RepID=UPI00102FF7A1|nr:transcriptional regulator [Rhizobium ruizarguesonis]MBY5879410.1 transcriptional regulator [Rhizobium leguminosarum]TAT72148.1 transcriptional regulator [Rhizobium ruizarguesonis]TAT75798.1 transcriptional regulator [Rhizobium ruizarguesonis]TAZ67742.1 transcriptional regulator [Rhizobium ruizarguesonis]TAZ89048.1 transcriptional regulator [Rhizobium ruizarguesonis]
MDAVDVPWHVLRYMTDIMKYKGTRLNGEEKRSRKAVPLEESHPHLKEFLSFLPKLNDESGRGMALIATSYLDELLKQVLMAFLREGKSSDAFLDGFSAPLGSLATRIAACHALGLINERERQEADYLRKVRNLFAHNIHVPFKDQNVKRQPR